MGQPWQAPKGVKNKNGKVWDPAIKASVAQYEKDKSRTVEEIKEAEQKRKIIERFE